MFTSTRRTVIFSNGKRRKASHAEEVGINKAFVSMDRAFDQMNQAFDKMNDAFNALAAAIEKEEEK